MVPRVTTLLENLGFDKGANETNKSTTSHLTTSFSQFVVP